jgi:hypothetical protein
MARTTRTPTREKEKAEDDWGGVHSETCFAVFRCLFSFLIQWKNAPDLVLYLEIQEKQLV